MWFFSHIYLTLLKTESIWQMLCTQDIWTSSSFHSFLFSFRIMLFVWNRINFISVSLVSVIGFHTFQFLLIYFCLNMYLAMLSKVNSTQKVYSEKCHSHPYVICPILPNILLVSPRRKQLHWLHLSDRTMLKLWSLLRLATSRGILRWETALIWVNFSS